MIEMKNSGVEWLGEIPDDWEVWKVKHAFIRKNEKAMQENPTILSLARSGVKERDISNNEGQLAESYYNYNPVEIDDLLINPMDLYSGANCSISKVKGVISPAYINLKAKKGISPVFYDYYFKVQYWLMAFFAHGNGVSFENRWTLNNETLQNYPIVAPSFETQQRIASYLDKKCSKIKETIQNQQQVIEKLKAYKQSLITEVVTGKIKIKNGKVCGKYESYKKSGIDWIETIPDTWCVCKIKYICTMQAGKTLSSEMISEKGLYPVYGGNGKRGFYTEYNTEGKYILIGRQGALCGNVHLVNGKFWATEHAVVTTPNRDVGINYLFYLLSSMNLNQYVSYTAAQPGLSVSTIINLKTIIIKSIDDQKSIVDYLDKKCTAIDTAIEQKQKLIEKLTEYKKSLIYECVTGKKEC